MMQPLIEFAADGVEHTFREAVECLAAHFRLTNDERSERLKGGQPLFDNRLGWARTYLVKAGLLASPRRGVFTITERGRAAVRSGEHINNRYLRQFETFAAFAGEGAQQATEPTELPSTLATAEGSSTQATPEDLIEAGYKGHNASLVRELLDRLIEGSDTFFEQVVVDLLVKMGYGGSLADAGKAIGHTGDEGIDGFIKEDSLGLDMIYIQAKKWKDTVVGRPEIQKFAGALHGQHARKGVFLTTSTFSREARECVAKIEARIVLIDGERLAELMIRYGVGINTVASYDVKRIDLDYFSDE